MKLRAIHFLKLFAIGLTFLSGCKKEVPNQAPNASLGIAYSLPGSQVIYGSVKAPDGGYLLWGYNKESKVAPDGFLMKLDKDQQLIWKKMIGGTQMDEFRSACYDNKGNILATGMSISYDKDNRKGDFPTMFTVYLTGAGEIVWEKYFSAPSTAPNISTVANKVLYLPNGNFALVGSIKISKSKHPFAGEVPNLMRAFILYINNKGDTIGNCSYDVFEDQSFPGKTYLNAYGINARLTEDGNILLFVMNDLFTVDYTGQIPGYRWLSPFMGGVHFFEINPNITYGYNTYISRKTITQLNIGRDDNDDTYFFSVPFERIYSGSAGYFLVFPTKDLTGNYFARISKDFNLLNNPPLNTELLSNITAGHSKGDGIWTASKGTISKLNENGKVEWAQKFNRIINVSSIYSQADESLVAFCTTLTNGSESDVTCLRFSANGELLK